MKIIRNTLYALKPIWKIDKWYVILNFVYILENIPRRLLNVLIIKYIVDAATEGRPFEQILNYGILFLALEIALIILKYGFIHLYKYPHEELIRIEIKKHMMNKSMLYDLNCFDNTIFFNTYTKAFSALDNVAFNVLNTLISLFGAMLSVFTLTSYIFIVDPIIILVSLIGSAISIFSNLLISKVSYSKKEKQTQPSRRCSYVQNKFFNKKSAQELRVENLSSILMKNFDDSAKQRMNIVTSHERKTAGLKVLFEAPLDISDMFMWLYIAYGIIIGTFMPGDFMSLSNAVWSLSQQIRNVFNNFPKLYENALVTDDIIIFDSYVPRIKSGKSVLSKSEKITLDFQNVSFKYETEYPILKNICFKISTGQRLAIVGRNGAGKSTLIKLILRLYDPISGTITLNGKPYSNYNLEYLRSMFSVVFQDYQYYAFTIAENILMRFPESEEDEKRVIDVLKKVKLYDKISDFPEGIYTTLTKEFDNNGQEFSGGEYQKLAIARALAKDTPIIIMDEPSSALDPIMEKEIADLINECFIDKIVIIISHKLSMTKDSNLILLLDEGVIKEIGNHEQLLSNNGLYAHLWYIQSKKYKD